MARSRNRNQVNPVETVAGATFSNPSLGAFQFLPSFPVDSEAGDMYTYPLGTYFTQNGHTRRSPEGVASEIKRQVAMVSYTTREHAKRIFLNDIDEARSDRAVRPSRTATFDVVNQIHLAHEQDTKEFFDDDTNFGTVYDLSVDPTQQWDDYDNSDPEDFMLELRLSLLPFLPFGMGVALPFIKLGITPDVYRVLIKHPRFIDRYKNTDGNLGLTQLAEYMKVGQIVVLESYINTKNEADPTYLSDPTLEPIWDNLAIVAYVDPTPDFGAITWGWSPAWRIPVTKGLVDSGPLSEGFLIRVREYREEAKGGGGDWREADSFLGHHIVLPQLGVKVENPISA